MTRTISFFSIPLTPGSVETLASTFDEYLRQSEFHHVVTANPELLLWAARHPLYAQIIKRASLVTIDGAGAAFMSRLRVRSVRLADRATGVEITRFLLARAHENHWCVLLVLPQKTLSSPALIARALEEQFPGLNYKIIVDGAVDVGNLISAFHPKIVFAAQGVPAQEEWIDRHRESLRTVSIALGVGGTFDFLSGTIQRAPQCIRRIGLEWLWRLLREPKRTLRIIRAVIIFPLYALIKK